MGWIVTGTFALISTIASIWLINKHLQWYTNVRPHSRDIRVSSLTGFSSENSRDVSVFLVAGHGVNLTDLRRYCSAFVYGPDLRFDQLRIVLVLGEEKRGIITALDLLAKIV